MLYGLSQDTLTRINAVFTMFAHIERAVLYGSRAKRTHKIGSDIDVTLWGNISEAELAQIIDAIDSLDLPYTFDISVFEKITHTPLREHIKRVGVELYVYGDMLP